MDGRSGATDDVRMETSGDGAADEVGMDPVLYIAVVRRGNDSVNEVRIDLLMKTRLKGIFHVTWTIRSGDAVVDRMVWAPSTSQVLGSKKL